MKKFLFVLIFSGFITSATEAQVKVRYQGDVQAGYSIGIGTFKHDRINLHFVNSARIGNYFSAGLGLGLDYYTAVVNANGEDPELVLPIYFNARGYLPASEKTELFLSADIGTSIGLTEGVSGSNGFLFTPSIGARFKTGSKNAITIGFGYVLQEWSAGGIFNVNTDAIQIKVGYSF